MSSWQMKAATAVVIGMLLLNSAAAQSQPTVSQSGDQSGLLSTAYVPPDNFGFQEVYDLLRQHNALEKIKEILSPFRFPEQLTIETTECGAVNSYYHRKNFKPTVTICYEFLKRILELLPNEATPTGLTPTDAAVGQFFWVTFHEVGHAAFDIFNVPIFGHEEDAADNFATFIMLQFGKGQARRLINGAAWAWRAYLGDYQRNPVLQTRLAAFATDHGLPQERFYNLVCLAFGANSQEFADFAGFLPPTRSPNCSHEYQTLVRAFRQEIRPHIDQEQGRMVLDTDWLEQVEANPPPQK
jgi:Putative metallopeptidase